MNHANLFRFWIVLILAVHLPAHESRSAEPQKMFEGPLVVVISGFRSDASAEQLAGTAPRGRGTSGMYQLTQDLKKAGFRTLFFNWNGTEAGKFTEQLPPGSEAITKAIHMACEECETRSLVVVGHSWGAHTMLEVAEELRTNGDRKIDLSIGVDPSSAARGERPDKLPSNIRQLVNFYTRNAFTWGAWRDDPRVENVDLGDAQHGFIGKGKPNYASAFDIAAHNAVEWDEQLHGAIVARIRQLSDVGR